MGTVVMVWFWLLCVGTVVRLRNLAVSIKIKERVCNMKRV